MRVDLSIRLIPNTREEWEEEFVGKAEATEVRGRDMAKPKMVSWRALKRVARYLVGVERVVWKYRWQDEVTASRVYWDSDWAGGT
eukprot:7292071-Karenia_brevis.AAC.1